MERSQAYRLEETNFVPADHFMLLICLTCLLIFQDAYRLQLKLFLYEVKQQQLLSGVRAFLKVYSTISLGKLATCMEVDEPTLRSGIGML